MSLVKVWTELDNGKCASLPAKIVERKQGGIIVIRYLSIVSGRRKDSKGRRIYAYELDTYEVTDESITEYLESDSEFDLGFEETSVPGEFVKYDPESDSEYVPSSSELDSDSESESLTKSSCSECDVEEDMDDYSDGGDDMECDD